MCVAHKYTQTNLLLINCCCYSSRVRERERKKSNSLTIVVCMRYTTVAIFHCITHFSFCNSFKFLGAIKIGSHFPHIQNKHPKILMAYAKVPFCINIYFERRMKCMLYVYGTRPWPFFFDDTLLCTCMSIGYATPVTIGTPRLPIPYDLTTTTT